MSTRRQTGTRQLAGSLRDKTQLQAAMRASCAQELRSPAADQNPGQLADHAGVHPDPQILVSAGWVQGPIS